MRVQVAALAAVLAAGGSVGGYLTTRAESTAHAAHHVVLGQSLTPLPVYRAYRFGADVGTIHATRDQRTFTYAGQAGRVTLTQRRPTIGLHVRYAHVRTVAGRWQIELTATEGHAFRQDNGEFYAAVIDGKAFTLFFVYGSDDGTNFAIGAGPNGISRTEAIGIARSLTTNVTVS